MTVKFAIPFGMKLWGWMNSLLLFVVDLLSVWFQLSGSFQFCAPKSVCLKRTNLDISQSKTQHKVRLFLQPPNHRLRWQSFRLHGIGQSLRSACEWGNPNGGRLLIWLWFRCALLQGELPWKKSRCHPCGKGWTFLSTRKREISLCAIQMFCPCALWTPLSGIWMHMTIWLPSFGDRGKWETTSVDQTRLHVICVLRYSNIEMKDPPSVVVGIFRIGKGCFPILVCQARNSWRSLFISFEEAHYEWNFFVAQQCSDAPWWTTEFCDEYPQKWLGGCFFVSITLQKGRNLKVQP